MSTASNLIERLEAETGQRIDSNGGDNNSMAGLFGAMSRLLGQSPATYKEHDDVVAGLVIKHRMSHKYKREQENSKLLAEMLTNGMNPNDIEGLLG